jgi:hypothetical protein
VQLIPGLSDNSPNPESLQQNGRQDARFQVGGDSHDGGVVRTEPQLLQRVFVSEVCLYGVRDVIGNLLNESLIPVDSEDVLSETR